MKISDNKFTDANCRVSSNKTLPFKIDGAIVRLNLNRGRSKRFFQINSCIETLANTTRFVNKEQYGMLEKISYYIMAFKYPKFFGNCSSYINLQKIGQRRFNFVISDIGIGIYPISEYKYNFTIDDKEDNNE